MTIKNSMKILPDSTGRNIYLNRFLEIVYTNALGQTFSTDDEIIGSTSSVVGYITRADIVDANNGRILVELDISNPTSIFSEGEDLLVNDVIIARVSTITELYVAPTNVVSWDNPDYGQRVDNQGAAFVRFSEGPAQLDAFGRLQVSQPYYLGKYIHTYDELPSLFETQINGSASIIYDNNASSVLLEVDSISGSLISRTSHKYHPYQPGVSQIVLFTVSSLDSGKDNVYKRWGLYDENDGMFFQISGSTIQTVLRSSASGASNETIINQTNWNLDKLDGSKNFGNLSQFNLDISKNNIYWIDYQWLGAGRVRFGVYTDEGRRVACHEIRNANSKSTSYMKSGILPLKYEIFNSGSTSGATRLRFTCASVLTEAIYQPFTKSSFAVALPNESSPGSRYNKIVYNNYPGRNIITIRPKAIYKTNTNRVLGVLSNLSLAVSSGSTIAVSMYKNCSLISASFQSISSESAFEFDCTGEVDVENIGTPIGHRNLISPGSENINLSNIFGLEKEFLSLSALGDQSTNSFSFVAHNLSDIKTSEVSTGSFFSSTNEITRTSGDFTADGFKIGDGIYVSSSLSNNNYFILNSVSPLTMSVRTSDTIVNESATNDFYIFGGQVSLVHTAVNIEEHQ
jgi:hypothetical protein